MWVLLPRSPAAGLVSAANTVPDASHRDSRDAAAERVGKLRGIGAVNLAVDIREAAPGDEAALALVGATTFLESYAGTVDGGDIVAHCRREHSADVYARWLCDPQFKIWLATVEPGEAPVGYLVFGPAALPLADLRDDDWEVKRVYLLSRVRGGGVGRSLIARAKTEAHRRGGRRLLVGVYARNEPAIAFYRREGFETAGTREFYVGENIYHDLVMAAGI